MVTYAGTTKVCLCGTVIGRACGTMPLFTLHWGRHTNWRNLQLYHVFASINRWDFHWKKFFIFLVQEGSHIWDFEPTIASPSFQCKSFQMPITSITKILRSGLTKRGYMLSKNGPSFGPIMLCMEILFAVTYWHYTSLKGLWHWLWKEFKPILTLISW